MNLGRSIRWLLECQVLIRFVAALAWAGLLGSGNLDLQASGSDEIELERARRAIRGDWYDDNQQTYVPPRLESLEDHPARIKGRLAGPAWDWQGPNWNFGWLRGFFSYLVITVLVVLLVLCILLLLMHFARSSGVADKKRTTRSIEIDLARVEDLPFSAEKIDGDPLAQARRLADAGRYDLAIVFLYGYFLLALDQARRIHLQKGKTNRMYLREIAGVPNLQRIVEDTMLEFERVYFGKHPMTREGFERSWAGLDEFHRALHAEPASFGEIVSAPNEVAEAVS